MAIQVYSERWQWMINSGFMRQNYRDMKADVICLCCFQTVAQSKPVSELAAVEEEHVCNPRRDFFVPQPDRHRGLYS